MSRNNHVRVCVCLFVSYLCVNGVGPGSVCVVLFPGLCGSVAQILLSGRHLMLLTFPPGSILITYQWLTIYIL